VVDRLRRHRMMARFTIKNLKEIEDTAGEHAPGLESRFGRKHLNSEHLGVSYFRYAPGFRLASGHSHREQEEAYVVVSGSGRMKLDDEIIELRRWDVVRVAPGTVRGLEGGPEGLEIIAVGSDRPEGGDGVQTTDWWPE
jgi:mannose-6-phosphate isomerase-like protein (cupin superfamily)